ncbi:MAG: hypothetical protein IH605_17970 [Burkholderiales bacterium]|nr:hypothetical protein [Burkholderiales bacterium]
MNLVACAGRPLRALRANPVFGTDEKRIRTKNRVIDKNKIDAGVYPRSPIAYGQLLVRAQAWRRSWGYPSMSGQAQVRPLRALRANRHFGKDKSHPSRNDGYG